MSNLSLVEPIAYESLKRLEKLALFLIILGPEQSANILQGFDEATIEILCQNISKFSYVDEETQKKVLDEFANLIDSNKTVVSGGKDFARKTLELSQGEKKAAKIIARAIPESSSDIPFMAELAAMEVRKIFNLIRDEQVQTIAFVAARLSTAKSVELITMMPAQQRELIIERMGAMEAVPVAYGARIVDAIKKQADEVDLITQIAGGAQNVANLLNALPKEMSKDILGKIEEKNEELGKSIRRKMFSFEDLIRLAKTDLQRIMREIETTDLVLALKTASNKLQQAIFGSVSKRAVETLKEEMQMLPSPKAKDIEAAQDRIIQSVRRLEDQGDITLDTQE